MECSTCIFSASRYYFNFLHLSVILLAGFFTFLILFSSLIFHGRIGHLFFLFLHPSISKNTQIVVYINLLVSVTVALKIVALFTFAIILSGSASLSLGCQSRWLIISILFMFFYLISTIPLCNEGNFQLPNLLLAYLFFLKNSAQN